MSHIFICYARENRPEAKRLYQDLCDEGFDVWLDSENLLPGVPSWKSEIRKAIHDAKYIVILLSRASTTKRGFVQAEIREALDASKEISTSDIFIIPARIEECTVPWDLTSVQWIDLFPSYEASLDRIVGTLRSQGPGEIAVPIAAVAKRGSSGVEKRAPDVVEFLVWYAQVLMNLVAHPKEFVSSRNTAMRSNLVAATHFVLLSAFPYSIFKALIPLDTGGVVYYTIGYMFITLILVFASSWMICLAWRAFGGQAHWMRYAITNSYYSGVALLLGFIAVMLAIGTIKLIDKSVLPLLREAAGGNIWPFLHTRPLENPAVIAGLWVLGIGYALLLIWTVFFWGAYRQMNSSTRAISFCAWTLSWFMNLPVGLVVAVLQQALFNFLGQPTQSN